MGLALGLKQRKIDKRRKRKEKKERKIPLSFLPRDGFGFGLSVLPL